MTNIHMKLGRVNALVMILLLVMIPISFAEIQRDSMRVYGDNQVDGFVKTQDTVIAEAQVSLAGDEDITPNQVAINNVPFTACAPDGLCTFLPASSSILNPGTKTYQVRLFNDEGQIQDAAAVSFVVDAGPPSVLSIDVGGQVVSGEEVRVSVSATDAGACSGIKSLEVRAGETILDTLTVENPGECSKVHTITAPTSQLGGDGEKQICASALDFLDQASEQKCEEVTVDTSAPLLVPNSFSVLKINGDEIVFLGPGRHNMRITAQFTDVGSGIATSSITADLSALGGPETQLGQCFASVAGSVSCQWTVNNVDADDVSSGILSFFAEDQAGNEASFTQAFAFTVDTTAPIAQSLTSQLQINGDNMLSRGGNTLSLSILESGSGFNEKQVYLNLQPLGGSTRRQADDCVQVSSSWTCVFENIDVSAVGGRQVQLALTTDSADDVGNGIEGGPFTFTIDNRPPTVYGVQVSTENEQGLFTSGSFITVEAHVDDDHLVSASGNFSRVSTDLDGVEGTCTAVGNGTTVCSWVDNIGPLRTGKTVQPVTLIFEDEVGNMFVYNKEITIFGIETDEADHIDARIDEPSPFAIDRQLMELTNAHMTFPVRLRGDNAVPIDVRVGSCTGEAVEVLNNAEPYENRPVLLQTDNPEEIFMEFSFDVIQMPYDNASITCDLEIVSLVNNQFLSNLEIEPLEFNIQFYNSPMGELTQNVKDRIDLSMQLVNHDIVKWLDTLETLVKFAEKICGIYGTVEKVMLIYGKITSYFGGCCGSIAQSAVCCSTHQVSAVQLTGTKEMLVGTYNTVKKWCALVGCTANAGQWKQNNDFVVDDYFSFAQEKNLPISNYRSNKGWLGNVEPHDSLFLSAAFFCIPGVIKNLQKFRQVECQYVECLQNTKNGLPVSVCDSQRAYMQCKNVIGEIFQLIPYAAAFSQIAQNVDRALKNPVNTIAYAASAVCDFQCQNPLTAGLFCETCSIFEHLGMARDVLCDLGLGIDDACQYGLLGPKGMLAGGDVFAVGDSVCQRAIANYQNENGELPPGAEEAGYGEGGGGLLGGNNPLSSIGGGLLG